MSIPANARQAELDALLAQEALPRDLVRAHLAVMEDWIAGRRSWINYYASNDPDPDAQNLALVRCAQADAAEIAKHGEAIRAYAALVGAGLTRRGDAVPADDEALVAALTFRQCGEVCSERGEHTQDSGCFYQGASLSPEDERTPPECICGSPGDGGPDYNPEPLENCPVHGIAGTDSQFDGAPCPYVAWSDRDDNAEPEWTCVLAVGHEGIHVPYAGGAEIVGITQRGHDG